jgi:D-amino-acid dehydrogenase
MTIGRMGNRVRASGGYTLGSANGRSHSQSVRQLFDAMQHYFPGAAQSHTGTQLWSGDFGSLPDGLPAIGPSGLPGVWLNIAHGTNGWGMACGSAALINAMISGQSTPIDPSPFNPGRF